MSKSASFSQRKVAGILVTIGVISGLWAMNAGMAFAAASSECASEDHYPLITKSELTQVAQAKSATIIDVNSDESYQKAHVPGAFHYGSHKNDFAQQLPADKTQMIVAYCGGPACTAWKTAAERACKLGYTNIRHFKGGISGWVKND